MLCMPCHPMLYVCLVTPWVYLDIQYFVRVSSQIILCESWSSVFFFIYLWPSIFLRTLTLNCSVYNLTFYILCISWPSQCGVSLDLMWLARTLAVTLLSTLPLTALSLYLDSLGWGSRSTALFVPKSSCWGPGLWFCLYLDRLYLD